MKGPSLSTLSYTQLHDACSPGGSTALTSVTELTPAGGPHSGVAPARYVARSDGKDTPAYAYETRFVDGKAARTVVIDQKQSQLNRIEAAILLEIHSGHPLLNRVPRIQVAYDGGRAVFTDLELPHRAFDGHIRAGTTPNGQRVTEHPTYRAARDASPGNARALLELSPGSLVFGAWDSTRKSRQSRYRSALVGEIIGVLADQDSHASRAPLKGGARIDPVGMSVQLSGDQIMAIMSDQRHELSQKTIDKIKKTVEEKAAKGIEKGNSGSVLLLGGIPPNLVSLGVVACDRIIRTHVLSFAALRQLRFGADGQGDVACRALLAAYALAGLARADSELNLRANCDLVECGPTAVKLDTRGGQHAELDALSIAKADALLEKAIAEAKKSAGISWQGQIFEVIGNPSIYQTTTADTAEE
jgi:CRISPR-associated protein Csb1